MAVFVRGTDVPIAGARQHHATDSSQLSMLHFDAV